MRPRRTILLIGIALIACLGFVGASGYSPSLARAQVAAQLCASSLVTVDLSLGEQPTNGSDVIVGTQGPDVIAAGDGDDIVCGLGGDDRIWGQGGDDVVWGGPGNDVIRGGDGADDLRGGDGRDDLAGGRGDDLVSGEDDADTRLRGGTGNDTIDGGEGDDELIAGNGGEDQVIGGPGDDILVTGGPRPDLLQGGPGNDVLRGHKGADTIFGETGDDALFGGGQLDSLDGGGGVDSCNGGAELATSTNCESQSNVVAPTSNVGNTDTCAYPASGSQRIVDFADMRSRGVSATTLNQDAIGGTPTFVRTVFELDASQMRWGDVGLELEVDIASPRAVDNRYRAELRETIIDQPIPVGSTQAYCMRFDVVDLPVLHGPVTIFQRFNRDLDGPDIEVELTGANQFAPDEANDLQVVAFDGRHRTGVELGASNTLLVVVYNHASDGAYKVVLNGAVVHAAANVATVGADRGGWAQFGLYPHGFFDNDGQNTIDQLTSGATRIMIEYHDFALVEFGTGSADLSAFQVLDASGGQPVGQ